MKWPALNFSSTNLSGTRLVNEPPNIRICANHAQSGIRPTSLQIGGSASREYVTCCEESRILQPVAQELCLGHLLPGSAMVRAPRCPKGVRLPRPRSPGEPGCCRTITSPPTDVAPLR